MTDAVFADTNVWLYAIDRDEPEKQATARAVLWERTDSRLVTSSQVMSEFYVNATRKLARPVSPEMARRMIDRMARIEVVAIDAVRVRAAIDGALSWGLSYWDALIIVAAQAGGCTRLLSEDLADGATYGTVFVENPFRSDLRASEAPASYGDDVRSWTDAELESALARYEDACRQAGMRPNAIHSYWDYARRFLAWRTGDYRSRGVAPSGRPVPVHPVDVDGLLAQISVYGDALRAAGLQPVTVDTYERHAAFFVRWLAGAFVPGSRLRSRTAIRSDRAVSLDTGRSS
jgi:predicted nucleic acid-binding protein